MRRKAILESHQVMLHSLRGHAAPLDLFQKHVIIVDSLSARGDFHALVQAVKAQGIGGIRRIIHRIEGPLLAGVMGDEYEIGTAFLFKIPSDQRFFLRLQVVRVADGAAVLFTHQPLGLVEPHTGDPAHVREGNGQHGKLSRIIPLQDLHHSAEHAGFHRHHVLKAVDISHFKIQGSIFIQMPLGVVLLRPEYGGRLKHPVKNAHHHLLIKLRTLRQDCGMMKIVQFENICAALCSL